MQLFKAHSQWKQRPSDERFTSLSSLHDACVTYKELSQEAQVNAQDLSIKATDQDLLLVGKTGTEATLTNWSMNQVSIRAGAPAGYLRSLPTKLAAENLNHGLRAKNSSDETQLLFHNDGSNNLHLRAIVSSSYSRIWNADVTKRLMRLQQENPNWINPMAYKVIEPGTNGNWPVMSSDMERAGLYASDHDMFAFLVDESKTIDAGPKGLNRGFFVWNSEVGASAFGVMTFLYDRVCGNNIVWGASNVNEIRIRHVGNAPDKAFMELQVELKKYADSSASEAEAMIEKAKNYSLGVNKEAALDSIFGLASKAKVTNDVSRVRLLEAIEVAEKREDRYGNPYTLWGVVSGLTEASQFIPHADDRMKVDRAAGKILSKVISF